MRLRKRKSIYISVLIAVLIVLIIISSAIGSAKIGIKDTAAIILNNIPGIGRLIDISEIQDRSVIIINFVRLPRIILSVFVGMALASAGVIFQGLFRNPMADPFVIGVSAGSAFGATIGLLFSSSIFYLNISATTIFAFLGAISTTFLIYTISRKKNKVSILTMLLAGIALSSMLSSLTSLLMIFKTNDIAKVFFWLLGGLTGAEWSQIFIIAPVVVILTVIMGFYLRDLNILSLGEERASQLGVQVEHVKRVLLILASLITAIAVSMSGIIGFVGLITPHIMRMIVGPDHKVLYPTSIIAGGIFLLISDTLARTVFSPREIPVGIITSLVGVPFFLYLLIKSKKAIF